MIYSSRIFSSCHHAACCLRILDQLYQRNCICSTKDFDEIHTQDKQIKSKCDANLWSEWLHGDGDRHRGNAQWKSGADHDRR